MSPSSTVTSLQLKVMLRALTVQGLTGVPHDGISLSIILLSHTLSAVDSSGQRTVLSSCPSVQPPVQLTTV